MKKTIFIAVISMFAVMACTKQVSKPAIKKSENVMRKRSNPVDDSKHY